MSTATPSANDVSCSCSADDTPTAEPMPALVLLLPVLALLPAL
ncbi:MAG: MYXO-CTERM sorting domain-containing protein, partial [Selenomonas sp.]